MPQPKKHASHADRQKAYLNRCKKIRRAELTAKGLPSLPAISAMPGWPRWCASVNLAHALVERTVEEMEEYYDERSETWQEGERGNKLQARLCEVQDALESLSHLTS